ncbi:MAG TPA: apolipoprotein N-acyltransferase [Gammaproteobacteria bacterium]|nr:apolipoprotein N-acyltransferase [Gammaproteobacteria bacterium]
MEQFFKSWWFILSPLAGALSTLAFAPFDLSWLLLLTLAVAFYCWHLLPAKQAAISGWLFGMGLQCSGVSWIYYSLHVHGSAPAVFAILLIFLLCAYLSLYTGLAAWVVNRFLPDDARLRMLLFYPASWLLFEWLQGYVMTGFAWMQLGYSQIDSPLAGFAPLIGNHALSVLLGFSAGALVLLVLDNNLRRRTILLVSVLALWGVGALLKNTRWTEPSGEAIRVSIIQGNIAQKDKWKASMRQPTKKLYRDLSLQQKDVDLIVWPETAIPDYLGRVRLYLREIGLHLKQQDIDLLFGIFHRNAQGRLLNSVVSMDEGRVSGIYDKRHLVPLGEYIPLRFLIEFFNRFVKIPMSDIISGEDDQPLITAAGVPIGVSICFEEAFSRDVLKDLPQAAVLLNVSNDAWFEDSIEPHQHHAIARMRALETGRYMIRSTNTGITSFIDPQGRVVKQLPQFEVGVLKAEVQPMQGATPYVRWGDWLGVALSLLVLVVFAVKKVRKS